MIDGHAIRLVAATALLLGSLAAARASQAPATSAPAPAPAPTSATAAGSSTTPPTARPPACRSPQHRQFDFWLGEWEVFRPDGKLAGRNRIEAIHDGCALRESWQGTGMSGSSLSSFDAATGGWHQTWVDETGLLLRLDGSRDGDSMVLRGKAPTWGRPGLFLQEIRWTPLAGGGVRQTGRLSEDDGQTWTTLFDLTYRRKG